MAQNPKVQNILQGLAKQNNPLGRQAQGALDFGASNRSALAAPPKPTQPKPTQPKALPFRQAATPAPTSAPGTGSTVSNLQSAAQGGPLANAANYLLGSGLLPGGASPTATQAIPPGATIPQLQQMYAAYMQANPSADQTTSPYLAQLHQRADQLRGLQGTTQQAQAAGGMIYGGNPSAPSAAARGAPGEIPPSNYYQQGVGVLQQLQQAYNQPLNVQGSPEYAAIQAAAQQSGQQSAQAAMENLNRRGILDSSQTAYEVGQAYAQANTAALPQEIAAAQQARQQSLQGMQTMFGNYQSLGQQQYQQQIQQQQARIAAQQQQLDNAINNVKTLGHVDNQSSIILGVPVGTLSADAVKAADQLQAANARAQESLNAAQIRANAQVQAATIRGPSSRGAQANTFGPTGNLSVAQALAYWKVTGLAQGVPRVPDGTPYPRGNGQQLAAIEKLLSEADANVRNAGAVGQQPNAADAAAVQKYSQQLAGLAQGDQGFNLPIEQASIQGALIKGIPASQATSRVTAGIQSGHYTQAQGQQLIDFINSLPSPYPGAGS